ncbi:helix-turn-helix domain-containing protein [Mucilaginibacter antarcticus]|uniref:Helix-turn-helix domain-containing protein n=1 Tax=Mucilaginibacter antarcticus TaxID=1855725 RepID=A0ABW5XJ37_9SPHI
MDLQQPALGKKIASLRKAKGLTQEELVDQCKLSVRTLQRIEAGEVMPRSYTIRLIFTTLGEDAFQSSPGIGGDSDLRKVLNYIIDLFNFKTNAMKKLTILSIFFLSVFILVFSACLGSKKALTEQNALVGTWQMMNNGKLDTLIGGKPGQIRYKVLTQERFVVTDIEYNKKLMHAALTGSYTVDPVNKTYSELVENAGNGYGQYMNGKIGTYNYKITDSLWYIKGNGYDEVWKKVK